ncbi:MAG: leucine-rich repeat protein [Alistipes sp.]|nr:leucine-rich repeat protein [Alistipes sp.]
MKRLFSLFAIVTMLFVTSCQYDDSALTDRVDNLENRVEVLETLCAQLNTNISSLQTIVSALQSKNFITSVEPILKDGKTTGWKISFTNGDPITIYNGVDGVDGKTPVIGVKKASDDVYYWTIDGEWLYDTDGNKVQAQATNGVDGADGVTPKFQINNKGYWEVSYDNGSTWTEIGKATGADGTSSDAIFSGVDEDDEYVYFTLADGSIITVPKKSSLSITFDEEDLAEVALNKENLIGYTATSITKSIDIAISTSNDLKARVIADDDTNLTGHIKVVTGSSLDEYSYVNVTISNGEKIVIKTLYFETQQGGSGSDITVIEGSTKSVPAEGGFVTLKYLSNTECEVVIPDAAKSWISVVDTRALQEHSITLDIKANTGAGRSAIVTVQSLDGKESVKYTITQPGAGSSEPITGEPAPNEIWYTSKNDQVVELHADAGSFGPTNPTIVSNIYKDGKGVITFDKTITKIANNAFRSRETITSIIIPSTITEIGDNAFNYCRGITSFTIPNNVTKIGTSAFYTCSSLKSIVIPNSVIEVGKHAFQNCNMMRSAHVPGSLSEISDNMFFACTYLSSITIEEGISRIGKSAFDGCANLSSITIPNTVSEIAENCFVNAGVKSITIPNKVTRINSLTFSSCRKLESVTLGKDITYIGKGAFAGCTKLTTINIPDGINVINDDTFNGCSSLASINIPANVTNIGNSAFEGCNSLENLVLPNKVTAIGIYAFSGCNKIKTVNIPQSVTHIDTGAFKGCTNLESFTGQFVIEDNRTVMINRTIVAFAPAGVTEYTVPSIIVSIGGYAFYNCDELTSVTIHNGVKYIYEQSFANCDNLKEIYCLSTTPPTAGESIFDGISPEAIIHVPAKCGDAYKTAWSSYADMIQEEPSDEPEVIVENNKIFYTTTDGNVVEFNEGDFGVNEVSNSYTEGKGVIEFDGDVTIIPKNTFAECANLATITLPNTVTSIEKSAFSGCSNLTSITLSNTLESIGERCFSGCSSLTTINIPESVETIGQFVCEGCPSLSSFTGKFASADGACLVIDGKLIAYATDYNAIYTIPSSVSTIGKNVFKDNSVLTSITIPESVETIESMAFLGCSNLSSIICQNATKAPKGADGMFDDIADDAKIYVPATAVNMYKEAWQSYVETDNIVAQE